jgi:hypothetical protein
MIRLRNWLTTCCILLATRVAAAQVREHVEHVEDIAQWRVEVFSGALNPGGLVQGPRLQAGHDRRGPMAFLATGEACTAGDVVFLLTRDGTVRLLAGDPEQPGYRDGPAAASPLGADLTVAADERGGLFIADRSNRCLRRAVRRDGQWRIETLAGHPSNPADPRLLKVVRDESPVEVGIGEERYTGHPQCHSDRGSGESHWLKALELPETIGETVE